MKSLKVRNYGEGPEKKIQNAFIKFLKLRDWYCKILHGNAYQQGMPDLFICHHKFGSRFVEIKVPKGYKFMQSQVETFKEMSKADIGIWVVNEAAEHEYRKLFKPANWYHYLDACKIDGKITKESAFVQKGPEADIQTAIIEHMQGDGWFCKVLHGNVYQHGMPDVFACRKGDRWRFIEVKNPQGYKFTGAQLETFKMLDAHNVGIWILTSPNDYNKLWQPPNWRQYL